MKWICIVALGAAFAAGPAAARTGGVVNLNASEVALGAMAFHRKNPNAGRDGSTGKPPKPCYCGGKPPKPPGY